ncbi:MAG TPA: class I SAM-dependent methyltransferase [Pyrinomonadaceae bacterium]
MQPVLEDISPAGCDESAYSLREKGYSPEPIRDAAWEMAGKHAAGRIVDVGSGAGGWIERLRRNPDVGRVTAVDIVDDGAGALDGVDLHLLDVSSSPLPCESGSADWVFALEVVEHLANPRHFVREAHRCLKAGGRMLITTPCNESLTARLSFLFRGYFPAFCEHDYRMSGHITPVTELELKRMAREAGFARVEFDYPLPGRIPKSSVAWQRVVPRLRGKLWSDTLFALLTK